MSHYCSIPLINRATGYSARTAIISREGIFSYSELYDISHSVASGILNGVNDLSGQRVAFLVGRGFGYVAAQWGIWRAGGVAVPLCEIHPAPELEYVIGDCGASILITDKEFEGRVEPISRKRNLRLLSIHELMKCSKGPLPHVSLERPAMIVYTSGTTGKPKGVVTTHKNIQAQILTLIQAWEWQESDYILNVLPLHHVHGIINIVCCALWAGAKCEIVPRFDPKDVWEHFLENDYTLFMAVPTIYVKLISEWDKSPPERQKAMSLACKGFRLMVSGSAALPVTVFEKWKHITGQVLLERYGMTEIGMALSNPLHGERIPGTVGYPLPGVQVRLVGDNGLVVPDGEQGEIQVRGPGVFLEYWSRPEETKAAWQDGWFCTGDIAVRENGRYRILGRKSTDIIKTGGYKVSAIEIEEIYRTHPHIKDCAVVGIRDNEWGERICIGIVPARRVSLTMEEIREWGKKRLAPYKVPTAMLILDDLPRNPLGKVVKKKLANLFLSQ